LRLFERRLPLVKISEAATSKTNTVVVWLLNSGADWVEVDCDVSEAVDDAVDVSVSV
jgi:hypothetical protein